MRITETIYFAEYKNVIQTELERWFSEYEFASLSVDLGYRNKTSAVYSSNIEGNSVDVNAYINSVMSRQAFKSEQEIEAINDLVQAYEFAQNNPLTEANLLQTHHILSQTILIKDKRGVYRTDRMGVFDSTGLVYLAIEDPFVPEKMQELFADIAGLQTKSLTLAEAFYHASLIHLKFVHIHPFWDGNGRAARLLEKWFLSEVTNGRAWKIQSEKYYKEHLADYYNNINLGVNYYELNYDKCMPFLLMLARSLKDAR
jgi:Fic family protein